MTNKRTDEDGGNIENRARFLKEEKPLLRNPTGPWLR